VSDDGVGRVIDVIWEREIAPAILENAGLPAPVGLDAPEEFGAFLDALRWTSASMAEGNALQAPLRGGVEIEDYQIVPVARAAAMPRVRLLLADDVGLGKTIEAGLIAQELIHSHRASRILVICPAHLKSKWLDEMQEKFGLDFRVIDRDSYAQLRREFGPTINPWATYPRIVTSLDYLKSEQPRRLFEQLRDHRAREGGLRAWDLLILDEAHNVAPAGRKRYIRDSDRTALLRSIANDFEHKLFLTATPHNGYRESFTGLLELLDDLRFSRGIELDRKQLAAVTIRRLKDEILRPDGSRRFPPRRVLPRDEERDPTLYVDLTAKERELFTTLDAYTASRLSEGSGDEGSADAFVLTLLKKRALSSPLALRETVLVHAETVGVREPLGLGDSLFRSLADREEEEWEDDEEKETFLAAATDAASRLLTVTSEKEHDLLKRLFDLAEENRRGPDSKASALLGWIETNLRDDGGWNNERVIIFTEYRHTLEYLLEILTAAGFGDVILTIYGGMPERERQRVHDAFQAEIGVHPVRILLATDAASEGADFQNTCRNLIHYDIPWNPVRLEQRNGRIDRHGQTADEVRIHHFVFRNHADSEFLQRVVEKVESIRADLGSVGTVIADAIRAKALGKTVDLSQIGTSARVTQAREELAAAKDVTDARALAEAVQQARRELGATTDRLTSVLRVALSMEGLDGSVTVPEPESIRLFALPPSWSECRRFVTRDVDRPLTYDRSSASRASAFVLHLDHPLFRRALATLRSQLWKSGIDGRSLHRVTATESDIERTTLTLWGRLVLFGADRKVLHEGLVSASGEILNDGTLRLTRTLVDIRADAVPSGSLSEVRRLMEEHFDTLRTGLLEHAIERSDELDRLLDVRGVNAEKLARALATERMAEIRRTLKEWEREAASRQLSLFDDEERAQRDQDLSALRARLEALATERETESKRQRVMLKPVARRVDIVGLHIAFPVTRAADVA